MAIIDLEKYGVGAGIRGKLRRSWILDPLHPNSGGYWFPDLLDGIYKMQRYNGKVVCVYTDFYEPSNQSQPNKVARQLVFADAVAGWQARTGPAKEEYIEQAVGLHMSGYNLFLRGYLLSH